MLDYLLALSPAGATREREEQSGNMTPIEMVVYRTPFPEQVDMLRYLAKVDPGSYTGGNSRSPDGQNLFHIFATMAARWRDDEEKGLGARFAALLEILPTQYLAETDSSSTTPLFILSGMRRIHNFPSAVLSAVIDACPEALRIRNDQNRLPAHRALSFSSFENIKLLIDAYPEGVNLFDIMKSESLRERPEKRRALVEAVIKRCTNDAVQKVHRRSQFLPLHLACLLGDFSLVKLLYESYPAAISHYSRNGRLPLHIAIENFNYESPSSSFDIIRFLFKHYPEAASLKRYSDDDDDEEEEVEDEEEEEQEDDGEHNFGGDYGKMTSTPTELCIFYGQPNALQRLLLRACPEADPLRWRMLNYEARREAMFLAFTAVTRQQQQQQKGKGKASSFVWELRRLMRLDEDMSLFKHIISFL
jgi:ankyrin repeat protein